MVRRVSSLSGQACHRRPHLPHQFRMQFPDVCGPLLYEMPGISTLAGCRVKCLWRNCMRMCVDQDVPWPACIRNLSRETGVAFARAGRASDETAIAFAGEKWAFLVQFSGAVVMVVSQLPHGCVLARKSSPCARKMAQNQRFVACRANFFAEQPRNGVCRPRSVAPPVRHAHCRATVISGRTGNRLAGITTSGWA